MSALPVEKRYTPVEYLALEEVADTKSEYINGRIYAMSGGSRYHSRICVNTLSALNAQLREAACTVHGSDMRVKSSATTSYFYPDVTVVCGEERYDDAPIDILLNPTVIVEVLSPSTEAFDRGNKFALYRLIPSLQEYVLISQHTVCVELYTRDIAKSETAWSYSTLEDLEAVLHLESIGSHVPLRDIYRKVEFPDKEVPKEAEEENSEGK